jgi:uncharacterized membrane protein YhaH (DUF805 family)
LGKQLNNFIGNYIGFTGRLNRQPFWMSAIVLVVAGAIVNWVLLSVTGSNGVIDIQALVSGGTSAEEVTAMIVDLSRRAGWISLITFIVLLYPAAAICIKRRHDRNSSGIDVWIYMGLTLVVGLVQAFGLGMTIADFGGITVPSPTPLMSVLGIVAAAFAIYLLVVMGFLKGTAGPNTYGPDPLQG